MPTSAGTAFLICNQGTSPKATMTTQVPRRPRRPSFSTSATSISPHARKMPATRSGYTWDAASHIAGPAMASAEHDATAAAEACQARGPLVEHDHAGSLDGEVAEQRQWNRADCHEGCQQRRHADALCEDLAVRAREVRIDGVRRSDGRPRRPVQDDVVGHVPGVGRQHVQRQVTQTLGGDEVVRRITDEHVPLRSQEEPHHDLAQDKQQGPGDQAADTSVDPGRRSGRIRGYSLSCGPSPRVGSASGGVEPGHRVRLTLRDPRRLSHRKSGPSCIVHRPCVPNRGRRLHPRRTPN